MNQTRNTPPAQELAESTYAENGKRWDAAGDEHSVDLGGFARVCVFSPVHEIRPSYLEATSKALENPATFSAVKGEVKSLQLLLDNKLHERQSRTRPIHDKAFLSTTVISRAPDFTFAFELCPVFEKEDGEYSPVVWHGVPDRSFQAAGAKTWRHMLMRHFWDGLARSSALQVCSG